MLVVSSPLPSPVPSGVELLTSYEQDSAVFWHTFRANMAQHTYCNILQQQAQVRAAATKGVPMLTVE